jgi:DNA repair exonuclease SbcCD ATPase subunit
MEDLIYRISFQGLDEQTKAIGQLDAEIAGLNQTVKANREEVKRLEKNNEQGTVKYQELQQAIGETIISSRELTKQKSDLIRQTQNEAKVNQKAEGSIDALRAQLSILTKEYNSLGKQQRETGKGKDIQNQAKAISDELKSLEGAIGDNRRNVGNYRSALASLENEMLAVIQAQVALAATGQKESKAYKDLDNQLKGLSQQYSETKTQASEVDNKFKELTNTTDTASGSVDSLKKQLRQIKEAAAQAGEGTEDFERLTAEAAILQDKIDDVNDALKQEKGTEFEKFRSQLGGVGQSLANLDFKQANERIANLGKTLKGLTFSSLKEGVKGATSSFAAFGKVLLSNPIFLIATIVAAVGIALFALKDKVKIIGQAFEVLTAPIRLTIQAFKDLGDAIGATSFAADEAAEKTAKAYVNSAANYKKSIDSQIADIDRDIAKRKAAGETINDIEKERLKILQESFAVQIKLLRGQQLQIEKGTEEYVKLEEQIYALGESYKTAKNDIEIFDIAQTKLANNLAKNKFDVGSIADLNEQLSKLQNLAQKTSDISKLKQLQEQIKGLEVRISSLKNLASNLGDEVVIESEITVKPVTTDEGIDDYIKELEAQFQEKLAATEPIIEPIKTEGEVKDERAAELQANAEAAAVNLEIASNAINTLAQLKDMETEQNIARINRERDAQIKAIQDSTLSEEQKAQKIAQINKQAEAKAAAERKKNAESQKRFALVQIALDTAKGIAAAVAAGAAAGPPPANLVAIAAGVAAVLSGIVSATAAVNSAKFAKGGKVPFNTGGVIEGASHANGGVPFVAGGQMMEAEGGELIVNKNIWSRPDFVDSISAMNAATGGVRFAEGGVVTPRFTPSGQSITSAAITKSQEDVSALVPILSNIQVTNNVVDTSSNQSTLIHITNNSTLG